MNFKVYIIIFKYIIWDHFLLFSIHIRMTKILQKYVSPQYYLNIYMGGNYLGTYIFCQKGNPMLKEKSNDVFAIL